MRSLLRRCNDHVPCATTATTVLGLPLYLGGGEMWEPMALAIMGGLLFSTLLTLGVVPCCMRPFCCALTLGRGRYRGPASPPRR